MGASAEAEESLPSVSISPKKPSASKPQAAWNLPALGLCTPRTGLGSINAAEKPPRDPRLSRLSAASSLVTVAPSCVERGIVEAEEGMNGWLKRPNQLHDADAAATPRASPRPHSSIKADTPTLLGLPIYPRVSLAQSLPALDRSAASSATDHLFLDPIPVDVRATPANGLRATATERRRGARKQWEDVRQQLETAIGSLADSHTNLAHQAKGVADANLELGKLVTGLKRGGRAADKVSERERDVMERGMLHLVDVLNTRVDKLNTQAADAARIGADLDRAIQRLHQVVTRRHVSDAEVEALRVDGAVKGRRIAALEAALLEADRRGEAHAKAQVAGERQRLIRETERRVADLEQRNRSALEQCAALERTVQQLQATADAAAALRPRLVAPDGRGAEDDVQARTREADSEGSNSAEARPSVQTASEESRAAVRVLEAEVERLREVEGEYRWLRHECDALQGRLRGAEATQASTFRMLQQSRLEYARLAADLQAAALHTRVAGVAGVGGGDGMWAGQQAGEEKVERAVLKDSLEAAQERIHVLEVTSQREHDQQAAALADATRERDVLSRQAATCRAEKEDAVREADTLRGRVLRLERELDARRAPAEERWHGTAVGRGGEDVPALVSLLELRLREEAMASAEARIRNDSLAHDLAKACREAASLKAEVDAATADADRYRMAWLNESQCASCRQRSDDVFKVEHSLADDSTRPQTVFRSDAGTRDDAAALKADVPSLFDQLRIARRETCEWRQACAISDASSALIAELEEARSERVHVETKLRADMLALKKELAAATGHSAALEADLERARRQTKP